MVQGQSSYQEQAQVQRKKKALQRFAVRQFSRWASRTQNASPTSPSEEEGLLERFDQSRSIPGRSFDTSSQNNGMQSINIVRSASLRSI